MWPVCFTIPPALWTFYRALLRGSVNVILTRVMFVSTVWRWSISGRSSGVSSSHQGAALWEAEVSRGAGGHAEESPADLQQPTSLDASAVQQPAVTAAPQTGQSTTRNGTLGIEANPAKEELSVECCMMVLSCFCSSFHTGDKVETHSRHCS